MGTPTSGVLSSCTAYPFSSLTGIASLAQGGSGYANSQQLVQHVVSAVSAGSGTATIPGDNTAPQNSEGAEVATVTITPKNTSNLLTVHFSASCAITTAVHLIGCVFKNSDVDGLAADVVFNSTGGASQRLNIWYTAIAGGTSAITFKIRMGGSGAGSWNVTNNGTFTLGGTMLGGSILEVYEYTP